jgi:alpha-glucoside transport system substrate-binding protein
MLSLKRIWLAMIFAFALVAAACNGEDPPTAVDDEEEPLNGDISVAAVWTGDEQASFEAVLDAFSEQTGVNTSYASTGDDGGAYLGTQIEGGNSPDVAMLPQPGLMADLANEGSLESIGDAAGAALDENYAPVWRDLGSVDGTLYGIYFKAANKSTWWYNMGVFEDAGVTPPETWEEMLEAASTTNAFGVPWVAIGGADGWTLTDWFENIYLRTAGPDLYDQLTEHEIPWTHDSVIEALEVFAELVGDEANIAGGRQGALQTDFPTSVTTAFTDPPEAATVYEGDFVAGVITGETDAQPGEDFDFFDFPSIEGSGPVVVGGGDIAVVLTDNPAAQAFVEFLATPEAAQVWAERGGFTSPNQNLDVGVYPDDITARSAQAVAEAEEFRFDLSDLQPAEFGGTVGRGLFLRFQEFLENPDDAEGAAQAMENDAQRVFD